MALRFVTLDQIKDWLGIELTNNAHDSVLQLFGESVENAVINFTETEFELQTEVNEIIDGNQSDVICPRNSPIRSVQKLLFHVGSDGSGGGLIDPSNYSVNDDAITLRGIMSPRGRGLIRVDYTWGYDGAPPDVIVAILQAVEAEFRRKGRKSIGIGGRSKKDESERYTSGGGGDMSAWDMKTGLPKEIVAKLKPYQRMEFPTQPMAARNV